MKDVPYKGGESRGLLASDGQDSTREQDASSVRGNGVSPTPSGYSVETTAASVEQAEVREEPTLRRFSHSLVQTFLQCPRKAYLQYVEKVPTPLPVALLKGQATDEAWNTALLYKMATGQDMAETTVLEITEQTFQEARERAGDIDWQGDTEPDVKDSTIRLSKTWARELAPQIEPRAVQVELHRTLQSGRDFIGFLDWVGDFDGAAAVGDNKTGKRRMTQEEAGKNLQPTAYAYLAGGPISFVFARAIDTGKSSYGEAVETTRSFGDVLWYAYLVDDLDAHWEMRLALDYWPVNPTSTFCGKGCPFYAGACPVGRKA